MTQQELIDKTFNELRGDNLHILDQFYDNDVLFVDPVGEHKGLSKVKNYYSKMYQNVQSIRFNKKDIISSGFDHVFVWTMYLQAKGLNGGKEMSLEGNSVLKFNQDDLVYYHRDYFDMGEFIYENVPVLSWVVKTVKKKLGSD